jgi:hypothetical protein
VNIPSHVAAFWQSLPVVCERLEVVFRDSATPNREMTVKLQQARQFALALPEAIEEPHFEYTSFRVRGKIFATAPPGGTYLHVFVEEEQRAPLIAAEPEVFQALHWGSRVVGVRITLADAQAGVVHRLLRQGWLRKAPKRLAATLAEDAS